MKLLIEEIDSSHVRSVIAEAKLGEKEKQYYIEGIMAQSELTNQNGRCYPKSIMERAIDKYQDLISSKRALGEINHPANANVNIKEASHIIESLSWDGNNVIGRARILTKLPMGQIAKGLIDENIPFGVSTRGLGTINERSGIKYVGNDFVINAIDIVSNPSAPNAWVNGIMEGAEWIYEASSDSWIRAERIKNHYKKIPAKRVYETMANDFRDFLRTL